MVSSFSFGSISSVFGSSVETKASPADSSCVPSTCSATLSFSAVSSTAGSSTVSPVLNSSDLNNSGFNTCVFSPAISFSSAGTTVPSFLISTASCKYEFSSDFGFCSNSVWMFSVFWTDSYSLAVSGCASSCFSFVGSSERFDSSGITFSSVFFSSLSDFVSSISFLSFLHNSARINKIIKKTIPRPIKINPSLLWTAIAA